MEWINKLAYDKNGNFKNSINNIITILQNDKTMLFFNSGSNYAATIEIQENVTTAELLLPCTCTPWSLNAQATACKLVKYETKDVWDEMDTYNFIHYLEKTYDIDSSCENNVRIALKVFASTHTFGD